MALIDVGSPAVNQSNQYATANTTVILYDNPANDNGVINSANFWAQAIGAGLKVGLFEKVGAADFKCRSAQTIGAFVAGSEQNVPVNIAVKTTDYIGFLFTSGALEMITFGPGIYWKAGDYFTPGNTQTYSFTNLRRISLNGTGVSGGGAKRGWGQK